MLFLKVYCLHPQLFTGNAHVLAHLFGVVADLVNVALDDLGLAALGGFWFFLRNKQNEMIKYYKQVGMTEEMYINELRKRNTDVKQLEAARKQWRKVKVDSIFEDPKARKKK